MSVRRTITLSRSAEAIRDAMVEWHEEQMQRWMAHEPRLQIEKREARARAEEHERMVKFWRDQVRFTGPDTP